MIEGVQLSINWFRGICSRASRHFMHSYWTPVIDKDPALSFIFSLIHGLMLKPQDESSIPRVQYPARVSFLENSREFFSNFTSRSRSRGIFISLFTLDLDFKAFSFHFSLSERVKAFQISLFFLEKKEWNMHFLSMKDSVRLMNESEARQCCLPCTATPCSRQHTCPHSPSSWNRCPITMICWLVLTQSL